jgi:hypothetical protein
MFDFQDLFQWDRFHGPDATVPRKRLDFLGQMEGRRLVGER